VTKKRFTEQPPRTNHRSVRAIAIGILSYPSEHGELHFF
jgi:hypothetical protein